MKATRFTPVLFGLFLAAMMPAMGQQEADKKKQEADAQRKKEQVRIVVDSKKDSQKDLQKAMEESLAAEEQMLKAKKDNGYINNMEFYVLSDKLKEDQKKLEQQMKIESPDWEVARLHGTPSISWKGGENDAFNIYKYGMNSENSSLSISKNLEDVTIANDFYYDAKTGSTNISFFVNGSLKAGELKITLKKPDKTTFQEFTISPLADVNWNQSFHWDEEETDEYLGKWAISISASKANGNYRVQVNSR